MWIKNTDGKPDAMLTIAIIAFIVVVINILLSTFGVCTIFGVTFSFAAMEAGAMTAFLAPTLMAYVTRRWTGTAYGSLKFPISTPSNQPDPIVTKDPASLVGFEPSGEPSGVE